MSEVGDFLFSVDLEDVRDRIEDGTRFAARVPHNTRRFLAFLQRHELEATFFVVGQTAEAHPELIREILDRGHEVACHTSRHVPLDQQTPDSFRDDLRANLDSLQACGAADVRGFRAPTFSLTEKTRWAYEVLEELGFEYSSSVLPGPNPLYGWPGFGIEPRRIGGVLEIPLTLSPLPPRVPLAGGVYFRVLPFPWTEYGVKKRLRQGRVVQSYFHPYDIDTEQERFMHPELSGSHFYNRLMYIGRAKVFSRLERLMRHCRFTSYRAYLGRASLTADS